MHVYCSFLEYVLDVFTAAKGRQKSEDFWDTMKMAMANIICQVVFGHRLEYNDDNLKALCHFDSWFYKQMIATAIPFYEVQTFLYNNIFCAHRSFLATII